MIGPAASWGGVCLKINPNHPVVLASKPLYGPLRLVCCRLRSAWEEIDINIRDTGLSRNLNAWDGIIIEGPVRVPGTDDGELDATALQALQVRERESICIVNTDGRLGYCQKKGKKDGFHLL